MQLACIVISNYICAKYNIVGHLYNISDQQYKLYSLKIICESSKDDNFPSLPVYASKKVKKTIYSSIRKEEGSSKNATMAVLCMALVLLLQLLRAETRLDSQWGNQLVSKSVLAQLFLCR